MVIKYAAPELSIMIQGPEQGNTSKLTLSCQMPLSEAGKVLFDIDGDTF
jgi:hypothetical protein